MYGSSKGLIMDNEKKYLPTNQNQRLLVIMRLHWRTGLGGAQRMRALDATINLKLCL